MNSCSVPWLEAVTYSSMTHGPLKTKTTRCCQVSTAPAYLQNNCGLKKSEYCGNNCCQVDLMSGICFFFHLVVWRKYGSILQPHVTRWVICIKKEGCDRKTFYIYICGNSRACRETAFSQQQRIKVNSDLASSDQGNRRDELSLQSEHDS